jgi:hypothetical protein
LAETARAVTPKASGKGSSSRHRKRIFVECPALQATPDSVAAQSAREMLPLFRVLLAKQKNLPAAQAYLNCREGW